MRDIVDDERRGDRPATAISPSGCVRRRPSASPALLIDVPHRLRRAGSHPTRRRTQRGRSDLCRGSLGGLPFVAQIDICPAPREPRSMSEPGFLDRARAALRTHVTTAAAPRRRISAERSPASVGAAEVNAFFLTSGCRGERQRVYRAAGFSNPGVSRSSCSRRSVAVDHATVGTPSKEASSRSSRAALSAFRSVSDVMGRKSLMSTAPGCYPATAAAYRSTDTLRTAQSITPTDSSPSLRNPHYWDVCTAAARHVTMRYAAQLTTMLLQPNATER